jgi:adenosylmethionine-8-amino-7-oxononanoate aminotransferase
MSPPLIITSAEIDDLLGRLGRALDETAKFVSTLA